MLTSSLTQIHQAEFELTANKPTALPATELAGDHRLKALVGFLEINPAVLYRRLCLSSENCQLLGPAGHYHGVLDATGQWHKSPASSAFSFKDKPN